MICKGDKNEKTVHILKQTNKQTKKDCRKQDYLTGCLMECNSIVPFYKKEKQYFSRGKPFFFFFLHNTPDNLKYKIIIAKL